MSLPSARAERRPRCRIGIFIRIPRCGDQPLLCHGWCGEDDGFLRCGEDPEDAGVSRNAAFSMDENVLEAYVLPLGERRFEPERNAREG